MKRGAEDFGLLFVCHLVWFEGIWALFPQIILMLKYPSDLCNWTLRWPSHISKASFDIKWGAEVFRLLFVWPCAWFGVFGPSFSKLSQYPSTWETGATQPKEGLDTKVSSDMIKELKTLDYFSCLPACDLGYLEPVSPICPNAWVPVKQVWLDQQRINALE